MGDVAGSVCQALALGIPQVGKDTARVLARRYGSLEAFRGAALTEAAAAVAAAEAEAAADEAAQREVEVEVDANVKPVKSKAAKVLAKAEAEAKATAAEGDVLKAAGDAEETGMRSIDGRALHSCNFHAMFNLRAVSSLTL